MCSVRSGGSLVHAVEQPRARGRAEHALAKAFDHGPRIAVLARVDQEIRFQQDTVVDAIDVRVGVMVRDEPRNTLHIRALDGQPLEKRRHQRRALQLLMLPVGVAALLPAQRTGDVVYHGGQLQHLLRMPVQPLQLSDGPCHRPDLEKMVNIMQVSVRKLDHPLYCR